VDVYVIVRVTWGLAEDLWFRVYGLGLKASQ